MNLIESSDINSLQTLEGSPADAGYYFPAEWELHAATWLSWPHNTDTWPGKFKQIYSSYCEFIQILSLSERVNINVGSVELAKLAYTRIAQYGAELENIFFYLNPTNDAWCRDHGPSFLVNRDSSKGKIIVDWEYNAWGAKYPPFEFDNAIPSKIASQLDIQVAKPGIVMEGGSVDVNGSGALITSESCLLNPNRNPNLSKGEIEQKLRDYYGVKEILWVKEGIEGDDTDGHIDDTVRFVDESSVICMIENDESDINCKSLLVNRRMLEQVKINASKINASKINTSINNEQRLTIIEIEMPEPIYYHGQRLPASYANFYITNEHVIVPTFGCKNDEQAQSILQECFPNKNVVGIDSKELILGFGSFHCLSMQEPI